MRGGETAGMDREDGHNVQATSLDVYFEKVLPDLTRRQSQVLDVFYEEPYRTWTNTEIAREVGLAINQVTPRTKELRDLGVLVRVERREDRVTGNQAYAMEIKR